MAFAGFSRRGLVLFLLFDLLLALLLLGLFLSWNQQGRSEELRNLGVTVYPEPREILSFVLTDHHGQNFANEDLEDRWTLLFFGYASCPDICPLTMAELDRFATELAGAAGEKAPSDSSPQVVMVSLDPLRDSQEVLARFISSFNEKFVGVSGSPAETLRVANQFFVTHSRDVMNISDHAGHGSEQESHPMDEYLITHSGHIAVVNPDSRFHAIIRPPVRAGDLLTAWPMITRN